MITPSKIQCMQDDILFGSNGQYTSAIYEWIANHISVKDMNKTTFPWDEMEWNKCFFNLIFGGFAIIYFDKQAREGVNSFLTICIQRLPFQNRLVKSCYENWNNFLWVIRYLIKIIVQKYRIHYPFIK